MPAVSQGVMPQSKPMRVTAPVQPKEIFRTGIDSAEAMRYPEIQHPCARIFNAVAGYQPRAFKCSRRKVSLVAAFLLRFCIQQRFQVVAVGGGIGFYRNLPLHIYNTEKAKDEKEGAYHSGQLLLRIKNQRAVSGEFTVISIDPAILPAFAAGILMP